jgi:Fibronectin type III-like domain
MTRARAAAIVVVVVAIVGVGATARSAPKPAQPIYLDPRAPIQARVGDLLHRMTLVGFARVDVPAGGQQTVDVTFPVSRLAVTPGDIDGSGPSQVETGSYQVQVGGETVDFTVG